MRSGAQRVVSWLGVISALILLSTPAWSLPRQHDGGFFLRLSAGGGAASTEIDVGESTWKVEGSGADVNLAVGAIVASNLALHGTLFGWSTSEPTLEITGVGSGKVDADLSLGAFGGGLTYYLGAANIYFSGSVGVGSLTVDSGAISVQSGNGVVVDLTAGKEWWVGSRWGLGVAAGFGVHSIGEEGVDENWSGPSFAVRFTATYN